MPHADVELWRFVLYYPAGVWLVPERGAMFRRLISLGRNLKLILLAGVFLISVGAVSTKIYMGAISFGNPIDDIIATVYIPFLFFATSTLGRSAVFVIFEPAVEIDKEIVFVKGEPYVLLRNRDEAPCVDVKIFFEVERRTADKSVIVHASNVALSSIENSKRSQVGVKIPADTVRYIRGNSEVWRAEGLTMFVGVNAVHRITNFRGLVRQAINLLPHMPDMGQRESSPKCPLDAAATRQAIIDTPADGVAGSAAAAGRSGSDR